MHPVLVVVPTYNEALNVERLARAVLQACPVDLLFVDDNSPDGTGKLVDALTEELEPVHVLHRPGKRGLGPAYLAGFRWGLARNYAFLLQMDADLSHAPTDVPRLLETAKTADLVLGSRYLGRKSRVVNWPLSRLLLSRTAAAYVRVITGMPFTDPTGGFKCFRRGALEGIDLDHVLSSGYSFQIEMTHRVWMSGCYIVDIPITFENRQLGQSKMSNRIIIEAVWTVWKLLLHARRRKPRVSS